MRIVLSLGLAAALGAQAAYIDLPAQTFEHAVGNGPELTLWFAPFDAAGGTRVLTAVTVSLDASLSARASAENLATLENTLTLQLYGGQVEASAPGGLEVTAALTGFAPVSVDVAPADGTAGSGPDYHDFGLVSTSRSGLSQTVSADLSPFLGADPFGVTLDAGGMYLLSGTAAYTFTVDMATSGSVAVRYTYTGTPEPTTLVLLGWVAAAGCLWRRPRRPVSCGRRCPVRTRPGRP